ncbi:MAG: hypothetical protein ACRDZ2_05475, partial [Ilumatobacteraceae bacterium]
RGVCSAVAIGAVALAACGSDEPSSTESVAPATVALSPDLADGAATTVTTPTSAEVGTTAPSTEGGEPATTAATSGPPTMAATTGPPTTAARTTTTEAPEPVTSCESVIHVGDSTSVSLISPSYLSDPEQRVDAQYRRVGALDARTVIDGALSTRETLDGQTNAFDRVTAIKADGYEGCWVFALGGNDTANVSAMAGGPSRVQRIETMMSAIGDDPVMWVNVFTLKTSGAYRNENMVLWNEALQEVLPRYPNMRVFDWASVVQPEWFVGDDIHYDSSGSAYRAALIANALAAEFPA